MPRISWGVDVINVYAHTRLVERLAESPSRIFIFNRMTKTDGTRGPWHVFLKFWWIQKCTDTATITVWWIFLMFEEGGTSRVWREDEENGRGQTARKVCPKGISAENTKIKKKSNCLKVLQRIIFETIFDYLTFYQNFILYGEILP